MGGGGGDSFVPALGGGGNSGEKEKAVISGVSKGGVRSRENNWFRRQ